MSLNSNNLPTGGGNIEPMAPGTYPARTAAIVDLGVQVQAPYAGKEKPPVNKIAITYEFVDEFMQDEDGNDIPEKPRWLTEMMAYYPISADKAKSTLRYKVLDPTNAHNGDFSKIVDVPVMVTVVHNPKKDGGVWENIGGVTAMREKDIEKTPELVSGALVFDLDEPDLDVYAKLPKFVQSTIQAGLEFEGSKLWDMLGGEDLASKETDDAAATENPF